MATCKVTEREMWRETKNGKKSEANVHEGKIETE